MTAWHVTVSCGISFYTEEDNMIHKDRQARMMDELREELAKVKIENSELINKCMEQDVEQSELIETLQQTNKEWNEALQDIKKARDEYWQLIKELTEFRKQMISSTRIQRVLDKILPQGGIN